MASTPLTAAVLAHFFTSNEKINLVKSVGILVGFSGIVFLFFDEILINENNFFSAFLILFGSCFYVVGGVLTLRISNKKNENVTASICIWATLFLFPISMFIEQPWNLTPRLDSTISLIYLGVFSTGIAWLLRFYILKKNGLVFQAQVAYLIPIFGVILGFIFLKEEITSRVALSLLAVILGIYLVKKSANLQVLKKKKKFI
jgi:drug/metabolite transporter (DMT)-like permease